MTYCSMVAALALVGSTKKHFGHYSILKFLSLRSPSNGGIQKTRINDRTAKNWAIW